MICQDGLMEPLPIRDVGCKPSANVHPAEADAEETAALFKALSDPIRLKLYLRIRAHDSVCVCDIQDVGVAQPTVSHHLKKLRDAGLIVGERQGTWVHYRAVEGKLESLRSLVDLP
jgi:ArsR family transcriptional regulator, arsenate/arsenite/antimonite-responsive transcriptional repressor